MVIKFSKMISVPAILLIFLFISCTHDVVRRALIGKWVFEEDEDEFSGRYIHEFTVNGDVFLYEYVDKEDTIHKRKDKIGKYKIEGKKVLIYWQNQSTQQEYFIQKTGRGLKLVQNQDSILNLIKAEQCNE